MARRKQFYQIVFAKCPNCHKTIERIGVLRKRQGLIGYIGLNCSFCKTFRQATEKDIEYIQIELPILNQRKTLVWRAD